MHHIILIFPNTSLVSGGKLIALYIIGIFLRFPLREGLSVMFWNELNALVSPIYNFFLVIVWKCGGGVYDFFKKIFDIELIAFVDVGD